MSPGQSPLLLSVTVHSWKQKGLEASAIKARRTADFGCAVSSGLISANLLGICGPGPGPVIARELLERR